jgi:hypothetical protein
LIGAIQLDRASTTLVERAGLLPPVGVSTAAFALCLGIVLHAAAELERYLLTSLLAAALFVFGFRYLQGDTLERFSRLRWQLTRTAATWAMTVGVLLLLAFVTKVSEPYPHPRGSALGWTVTALAFLLIVRSVVRFATARWLQEGYLTRNVVIVGEEANNKNPPSARQDRRPSAASLMTANHASLIRSGCKVLGNTDDLLHLAAQFPVAEIVIAQPLNAEQRLKSLVDKLRRLPVDVRLSAEPIAEKFPLRSISHFGRVPLARDRRATDQALELGRQMTRGQGARRPSAVCVGAGDRNHCAADQIEEPRPGAVPARAVRLQQQSDPGFQVPHDVCSSSRRFRGATYCAQRPTGHAGRSPVALDEPRRAAAIAERIEREMSLVRRRPHAIAMKAGDGERLYFDAVEDYPHRHRVKPGHHPALGTGERLPWRDQHSREGARVLSMTFTISSNGPFGWMRRSCS